MEFSLRLLGFMKFLQNNNHQAVNKTFIHIYIYLLLLLLLLLYNSSILAIEHSPYYIALGSPQPTK